MSIFTSNRNLSSLVQAALRLKETKQSGDVKEEMSVEAAPAPQVSKSPGVSPLVVNNNFFLTYNNVDMKEIGVAHKVDIAKSYRQDSSIAEEVFGRDYTNAQPRSTSTGSRGSKFNRIRQIASEDLAKLAEAMRKQLRQELGDDYNSEVVERIISEATNSTLQYFSDNKFTKGSKSYRAQEQDCGFVFTKRKFFLAVKGVYSYNTKALADLFIKNFNAGISRNAEVLNTAYAKRHPSLEPKTSILPKNLQNIKSKIYSDPSVLKQIQAKTRKDVTSLDSYRDTITAVLLKYDKEPNLEVVVNTIASCIDSGVQEALVKKSSAMKEVVNKNALQLEQYLESAGEISYGSFEKFLKSKNPNISNEELMSAQSFLTSFASKYISGVSVEAAAKDLESGIVLPKTATAMTRGVTSNDSSWKNKVKVFVKDVLNSPTFKAAICVAFPALGAKDKAEMMSELVKSGDYRTAIIMGVDPTYHVGEINAAVSSEPAYNIVMTGLDFVPVVGEAAGVADFAISMHGALHNYTYSFNDYANSFPFRTNDMTTSEAANWHLVYDSLASVLGVVPGISSGTVKLSLSGLADVFKNAGKHMDEIVSFLKSGKGLEILKDITKDIITCKSVDEAKLKLYQKLVQECPNLAALVKNVLVKDETENNQNRVDTENPDELPGGGGDVSHRINDNRIKDLNGTYMPGINFQPAAGEGADWSGSMGDKNKVSGSDNNDKGFADSYQAGFFQDGKMVTIEPTEENEAKLKEEIEDQIKNDYGSLDNVEHRITFVYDDKGDIKGAVIEVKSKAVVGVGDAGQGDNGALGDSGSKEVGERGYGLGKVGEDVYGRGYFPGVGLNVYDYMGEGGRIDVDRFISDWKLNGGEAYSYNNSSSINTTLTAIFEAQQSGNWAKFWNNVGNFENYSNQDISKLFGKSTMQNAESNIEKAINYFDGIGPDETIVVGIVDGMFVAHGEVVYDSNGNICTFLKGWGWKIEKPVGNYMGSDGVLYYQYPNGGLLSEEELKKKSWGCNLGLAVSDGKI